MRSILRPKIIVPVVLGLFIIGLASSAYLPQSAKARITDNVLSRQFLPLFRSLKKIPDLVFIPYLFSRVNMEKIDIVIDPKDIFFINESLPKSSPFTSVSLENNRVFTKAYFTGENYSDKIDIRYKGLGPNHWNSFKKSYRIQFPDDNLYKKGSGLNLVIPDDKAYYADLLNEYRANKLGLLTKNIRLANVTINGQSHGVYLTSDNWSHEFLEGRRIPEGSNLLGLDEGQFLQNGDFTGYESIKSYSPEYEKVWKSYNRPEEMTSYEEITALLQIVKNADDATFKKLIPNLVDLESFYRWNVINVLSGNPMVDYENIIMVFNTATGKFEFMIIDTYATSLLPEYTEQSELAQRILSIDEFKKRRDEILREYISDEKNLEDDLAYYDALYADTKNEFFRDFAKKDTNFTFISTVRETRKVFEENFKKASQVFDLEYGQSLDLKPADLKFTGSFDRFAEVGLSRDEFVYRNPEFKVRGPNGVALLPGQHVFTKNVFVPAGVRLTIDPGATVYLGENVSLLVYGPIDARGTVSSPIRIARAFPAKKWGVFSSVNAKDMSYISYVNFDGGSGGIINGIVFTGMAAFHGSSVKIDHSSFTNAGDDDGLNVKYGQVTIENSVFSKNASDAMDLDFSPKGSKVSNNSLTNNGLLGGGDGIDLSWGDMVEISRNDIDGCTDKGVSVGEHSTAVIENNHIKNCPIGVAVKDLSLAEIIKNHLHDVKEGISAYRKKAVFGGGTVKESENIFENVEVKYKTDEFSKIESI